MNAGIGNVKGKSGGGSVAVVEINASQIDENTGAISFTEAQYNTFNTNQLVVFQIEGETIPKYLFSVSDDGAKLNCLNLEYDRGALQDQSDATLNVMFLYINKTPLNSVYTGYFINDTFSKGGGGGNQLYRHCITIGDSVSNFIKITIIDANNTLYTDARILQYLKQKGFTTTGQETSALTGIHKYFEANGRWITAGSSVGNVQCISVNTDNDNVIVCTNSVLVPITLSQHTINDIVITL